MDPISQPPQRTKYMYDLEQLQSTNTCGVGRGTLACETVIIIAWESNPPPINY